MRPAREDQRRFEQLVTETRADLLAYALRRASTPEDAADVIAETFLIAWRKLDSVPAGDEARLWLFGVARNVLRRGTSRELSLQAAVERLAHELRDAVSNVEAAESESSPSLRAAIQSLSETQREVILLTAWEGLSPREIATVTGAPVNLVRVRLHRARERLKKRLQELGPRLTAPAPSAGNSRHDLRSHAALDSTAPH